MRFWPGKEDLSAFMPWPPRVALQEDGGFPGDSKRRLFLLHKPGEVFMNPPDFPLNQFEKFSRLVQSRFFGSTFEPRQEPGGLRGAENCRDGFEAVSFPFQGFGIAHLPGFA